MSVFWGLFHDVWNAIKTSAKKMTVRKLWNWITKFAGLVNLNHGPFRSGAWGRATRAAHREWVQTHSTDTPVFREAAVLTARHLRKPCFTEQDYARWYAVVEKLPSCVAAGPIPKFARWGSIQQCWRWHRPEPWFLKPILRSMSVKTAAEAVAAATTQMLDQEVADRLTTPHHGQGRLD